MKVNWQSVMRAYKAATGRDPVPGQVFEVNVNGAIESWTYPGG